MPKEESAMRKLPCSERAELSILSTMLQHPDEDYIDIARSEGLGSEMFYVPANGVIYEIILNLYDNRIPIEIVSFTQKLKDLDLIDNIGGPSRLSEIYTYSPSSAHFKRHLKIVIEKFKLRSVISTCSKTIIEAYDNPENVTDFISRAENEMFFIKGDAGISENISGSRDLLKNSIDRFEGFVSGKYELEGLPTRFKVFNDLTKGLKPQNMIVIAARPSMGKTALLCNMIEDLHCSGVKGVVFSCEMSSSQLWDRILYGRARIPMQYFKKGYKPTKGEIERLKEAIEDLKEENTFIDETASIRIDEIRSRIRVLKRKYDIRYAAIDYLQLARATKENRTREQEVSEVSSGLKAISKEENIPIIVLAQLSRGPENRQKGIPKMSDLRESGAIEQDADIIGLLYRPDYYSNEEEEESSDNADSNKKRSKALLIIDKNRNGPTGEVEMTWDKEIMKFS